MGIYLICQFSYVGIYFDDYAYYSLNYATSYSHIGNDFSLSELFNFLGHHYFTSTNGRLLYFFVWLFIYYLGGVKAVQIVAAIIVLTVIILFWRLVVKYGKIQPLSSAFLCCAFYGLIDIVFHQYGTYWFAAFFLYVMPIIPITTTVYLFFGAKEGYFSLKQKIALVTVVFISAFSVETLGIVTIALTIMFVVYDLIQSKRINRFYIILFIIALAGTMILMLSPGMHNRASAFETSIFERIGISIPIVLWMFFTADAHLLLCALFMALTGISLFLSFKKNNRTWMRVVDAVITIYFFVAVILYWKSYDVLGMRLGWGQTAVVVLGIWNVILIIVQVTRFYIAKKHIPQMLLFYAAVIATACICAVPEYPFRLLIPMWLLLFPLMSEGIMQIPVLLFKDGIPSYIGTVLLCIVIGISSYQNAKTIYNGYRENYEILEFNDSECKKASEAIERGETVETVKLKELKYDKYACLMVYQEGYGFMKPWILKYYALPDEITFSFTPAS